MLLYNVNKRFRIMLIKDLEGRVVIDDSYRFIEASIGIPLENIPFLETMKAFYEFDFNLEDSINGYDLNVGQYKGGYDSSPPYIYQSGGYLTYEYSPYERSCVKIQSLKNIALSTPLPEFEYKTLQNADVIQDIIDEDVDASLSISLWIKFDSSVGPTFSGSPKSFKIVDTAGYAPYPTNLNPNRMELRADYAGNLDPSVYKSIKFMSSEGIMNEYSLAPGDWHHVVMTRDGSNGFLYVDASCRGFKTDKQRIPTSKVISHFGDSIGFFIGGNFKDLKIINEDRYWVTPLNSDWVHRREDTGFSNPVDTGYTQISNLRIFSSAISENDVKYLYYNNL